MRAPDGAAGAKRRCGSELQPEGRSILAFFGSIVDSTPRLAEVVPTTRLAEVPGDSSDGGTAGDGSAADDGECNGEFNHPFITATEHLTREQQASKQNGGSSRPCTCQQPTSASQLARAVVLAVDQRGLRTRQR